MDLSPGHIEEVCARESESFRHPAASFSQRSATGQSTLLLPAASRAVLRQTSCSVRAVREGQGLASIMAAPLIINTGQWISYCRHAGTPTLIWIKFTRPRRPKKEDPPNSPDLDGAILDPGGMTLR
jgi:hypothetical protein